MQIVLETARTRIVRHEVDGGFLQDYVIEHKSRDACGEPFWARVHTIKFDVGHAELSHVDQAWVDVLRALLDLRKS